MDESWIYGRCTPCFLQGVTMCRFLRVCVVAAGFQARCRDRHKVALNMPDKGFDAWVDRTWLSISSSEGCGSFPASGGLGGLMILLGLSSCQGLRWSGIVSGFAGRRLKFVGIGSVI